jgi:hypothetical protein
VNASVFCPLCKVCELCSVGEDWGLRMPDRICTPQGFREIARVCDSCARLSRRPLTVKPAGPGKDPNRERAPFSNRIGLVSNTKSMNRITVFSFLVRLIERSAMCDRSPEEPEAFINSWDIPPQTSSAISSPISLSCKCLVHHEVPLPLHVSEIESQSP